MIYDSYLSNSWVYLHETKTDKQFRVFSFSSCELRSDYFMINILRSGESIEKHVTWSMAMFGTTFLSIWIHAWFRWFLVDYVAFCHFLWWKVASLRLHKSILFRNVPFLPFFLRQMWNYLQTNPCELDLTSLGTWSVTGTQTIVRIYTKYMAF